MAKGLRTQDKGGTACGLLLTTAVWVSLQDEAKEDFAQAIGWCVSLITDYRVRLGAWGWGSGAGFPSCPQVGLSSPRSLAKVHPGSKQDSFLCMSLVSIHRGSLPRAG